MVCAERAQLLLPESADENHRLHVPLQGARRERGARPERCGPPTTHQDAQVRETEREREREKEGEREERDSVAGLLTIVTNANLWFFV